MSQRQLAKLLDVSRVTVIRWENDQVTIPPATRALLRVLEVRPEDTLEILRRPEPPEPLNGHEAVDDSELDSDDAAQPALPE